METVISRDGTAIAFDRLGNGPAVILVGGAMGTRAMNEELSRLLASDLTVLNYDRRGRGDSGDTQPYAPEREFEDLSAMIAAAGGRASLYGVSSGAITVLEYLRSSGAARVERVFLYEPPFIVDDRRPPVPADSVERLDALVADGRRDDAVEYFLTDTLRFPERARSAMRDSPEWPSMVAIAHTLAYDGRITREFMTGRPLPADRWSGITAPTLVMTGSETEPFIVGGARQLVERLPDAGHRVLPGQTHGVEPAAIAPEIVAFLTGRART